MLKYFLILTFALQIKPVASQSHDLYVFLLEDCVISRANMEHINALYKTYGDSVNFHGVFPNKMSTHKNIDQFKNDFDVQFSLKTDHYKKLSNRYSVKTTPEVVLVNISNGKIVYQGAIDNEFLSIGKRRKVITKFYLKDALESVSNGIEPNIKSTKAVGCFIEG